MALDGNWPLWCWIAVLTIVHRGGKSFPSSGFCSRQLVSSSPKAPPGRRIRTEEKERCQRESKKWASGEEIICTGENREQNVKSLHSESLH